MNILDIQKVYSHSKPPAKHNKNTYIQIIDQGGALYRSDGEFWVPQTVGDASPNSKPLMVTSSAQGIALLTTPDSKTLPPAAYNWTQSPHRPRLLVFGCSIAQQCSAFLHSTTATIAGGDVKAGAAALTVSSGPAYTAGQKITMPLYNARLWTTTISSISGNILTIADKTPGLIRNGVAVTINTWPTVPALDQGLGAVNAAVALLGGPVEVVSSYGYGGAIFQQMYCDLERDLRYYRPQYVALHMYENDMCGTVASGAASLEQFKAWARQMARMCLSYGAIPIVYSSMPYYNSTTVVGIPPSRAADYDGLAAYVGSGTSGQLSVDVPGAYGDNSVSFAWLDTSNPTWPRAPLAGWTDGVHVNTDHRFAEGLVALPVLQKILPAAGSLLDYVVSNREASAMAGTGGALSNLVAGSVVPKGHTCAAYGTAVGNVTTSRNADGSLKIIGTWAGAANRTNDYISDWFTFTFPTCWPGSTQRFKVYIRVRVNSMVGIAQIFPECTISTGEDHTGGTGADMCVTMPADGRVILMETPHFAIGEGAVSMKPTITIRPVTAASPANAYIDIDVLEMGVVPCMPEVPHAFI